MRALFWFFLILLSSTANAISSFDMSASLGVYRDFRERQHLPLYYSLRYNEIYAKGVRTQFDLILNNDLANSDWEAMSSHASVFVPFEKGSVQLGRQSFLGPFDFGILDGVQIPYAITPTLGVRVFGGFVHPLDLSEPEGTPLIGAEVYTSVWSTYLRAGSAWRYDGLSERSPWLSASREFISLPWSPGLLAKLEVDDDWSKRQSLTELTLNPWDGLFWSIMYSDRLPHKILADENYFLYRMLAVTPQKTFEQSWHLELSEWVTLTGTLRWLEFEPNTGRSQTLGLIFADDVDQFQLPTLTHIESYGGELWDVGSSWWHKLNDDAATRVEVAVAHFDKINGIKGWGYHLRGGLEWQMARGFFVSGIGELERNQYFTFDMRALVNVTFFN